MRWYLKVAVFHIFSAMPGGKRLYRFSQERITKGLVPSHGRVRMKMDVGWQYWSWLKSRNLTGLLKSGTHLDFGAGWHPTIPLLFYSFGVDRQYLLDVQPLLRADLLAETTRVFREIATDPRWPHGDDLTRTPDLPKLAGDEWRAWLASLGMQYIAPYDGATQDLTSKIDVVTSTQVFPYISPENVSKCFRIVQDVLKPGGLFFATIHLKDFHAGTDRHVTPYNHLKFSPWWWDHMVNTKLMVFNRLKPSDYRRLLEQAGFVLEAFDVEGPSEVDLRQLDTVPIHKSFAAYSREELAAKHLFFVARKS